MLRIDETVWTFATIECDRPACANKMNLQPGPMDIDREQRELRALRNLATQYGWRINNNTLKITCPYHTQEGNHNDIL